MPELSDKFPVHKVSQRPGPRGIMLDYIAGEDVLERLLEVDPSFRWSVDNWKVYIDDGWTVFVEGTLSTDGTYRSGMGSGYSNDPDMAVKTAHTEALKNAAKHFGVGLYLFHEKERELLAEQREELAELQRELADKARAKGIEVKASSIAAYFDLNPEELDDLEVLREIVLS